MTKQQTALLKELIEAHQRRQQQMLAWAENGKQSGYPEQRMGWVEVGGASRYNNCKTYQALLDLGFAEWADSELPCLQLTNFAKETDEPNNRS